ncbi:MAG: hypothetical protein JW892_02665 [Anaerolineae bacterium]|nr:hypothetical protein [Anaerolineae bacterium]
MRATRILRCWLAALVILVGAGTGTSLAAPLAQSDIWVITYPTDGTAVSGEVVIQGTASHASFNSYGVLYAAGPTPTGDSQWVPIVFSVPNMVVNGALATWDTTKIPNGQYTLALAVYAAGSTDPNLHFINYITVQNDPATPTPTSTATPEVTAENEEQPTQPSGPIEVPTIEQPPTATPRPTATPDTAEVVVEAEEDGDGPDLEGIFSGAAIKEAFMSGVWIAVMLYAIGILYVAARAALRYFLRQQRRPRQPS